MLAVVVVKVAAWAAAEPFTFAALGCMPYGKDNFPAYERLLAEINRRGGGPQGFGGDASALAVHVEMKPCHIACLPVAVNVQCHAARHCEAEI